MNKQEALSLALGDFERATRTHEASKGSSYSVIDKYGEELAKARDHVFTVAQQLTEPDDAMVERVARALLNEEFGHGHMWEDFHQVVRDKYIAKAKAAIAAMKEGE